MNQLGSFAKIILKQNGEASRPVIIHVDSIKFESIQKEQSILYYQIPFTFTYLTIQKLKNKDIFLPDSKLNFKIINYVKKTQEYINNSTQSSIKNNQIYIKSLIRNNGYIEIKGTILNQAKQQSIFIDISLKNIQGYQKFNQYRKKYKTLQNITRKIQFLLDHRIKMIYTRFNIKKQFLFSMDQINDKQIKNWYIQLDNQAKMTIILEEITKVGDLSIQKIIQQAQFQFNKLSKDKSYDILMQMSQHLKITFSFIAVKNKNISKFQFASLRVLQTSSLGQKLRIGNQQSINSLSAGLQLSPIFQNKYFDLQYGYLNQNLKSINQLQNSSTNQLNSSIIDKKQNQLHKNLQKLTPSTHKYQHFINQTVLDMSNYKNLVFKTNQNHISIPSTYLLEGYNVFHNQNIQIKFLLQVPEENKNIQLKQTEYNSFKAIPRKLIKVKINNFLNFSQVLKILQKPLSQNNLQKRFYLKIKCQNTIYSIDFDIINVNPKQFKSQIKQLDLRTEYSQFSQDKFILLTKKTDNSQKLIMIKSVNLQMFYLFEMTDTTPITFNLSTKKDILMQGIIQKSQFYRYQNGYSQNIILSSSSYGTGDICQKSIVSCEFSQIYQNIQGSLYNYKFKYRITTQNISSNYEATQYDFQILRIKQQNPNNIKKRTLNNNNNRLTQKTNLQIQNNEQYKKNQSSSANVMLKQFSSNSRSSFVQKGQSLLLAIKLKKMYYNYELNLFDNDVLIQKRILLNRDIKDRINQGILISQIPPNFFRVYKFEAYDENIKQKINLHIQIFCQKQPFGIGDQHVYRLKIPSLLWKMNSLISDAQSAKIAIQQQPKIQIQTFISSKKQQNSKLEQILYNSGQEISLNHFNHNDGISVKITKSNSQQYQIGYNKIRQCIKARCQVVNNQIGWLSDGQWYFSVLNMGSFSFYFLIKMEFDANAQRLSSNQSRNTNKTKSKQRSVKSNSKGGPDLFAKTLKNFDIVKLKQTKNKLEEESRQLTAKYVQKQEMIIYFNKKIAETDQFIRRKKQQMQAAISINEDKYSNSNKNKSKKQNSNKKISLIRSICECGQRNPQYMGYCKKCLQKLRQSYEIYLKEYQEKASAYEMVMFQKYNIRDKIQRLKTRLRTYKKIMNGDFLQGENDMIGQQDEMREFGFNAIEEKRLVMQVFQLQRQRQMQFQRRKYQMQELQKKIKKEDDQIWAKSQQMTKLNTKLNEIKQQISKDQSLR